MALLRTRFLLADDDADDAQLFCEALCRIAPSMNCQTVENGRQLLECLASTTPDVIFIDINMPVMNGWDTLRSLKSHPDYQSIPTIIYSTSSADNDIRRAYDLGASLFMTKPDDFNELCKILEIVATSSQGAATRSLSAFGSVKPSSAIN